MKLTLLVVHRTEGWFKGEPRYSAHVKIRGELQDLSNVFRIEVTKEEYELLTPGSAFKSTLSKEDKI